MRAKIPRCRRPRASASARVSPARRSRAVARTGSDRRAGRASGGRASRRSRSDSSGEMACSSTSASSCTRSHGMPSASARYSSSSRWWRMTSSATRSPGSRQLDAAVGLVGRPARASSSRLSHGRCRRRRHVRAARQAPRSATGSPVRRLQRVDRLGVVLDRLGHGGPLAQLGHSETINPVVYISTSPTITPPAVAGVAEPALVVAHRRRDLHDHLGDRTRAQPEHERRGAGVEGRRAQPRAHARRARRPAARVPRSRRSEPRGSSRHAPRAPRSPAPRWCCAGRSRRSRQAPSASAPIA